REAIKTRTAESIFTFDNETQGHRQLAERLLICFDCRQPRDQIAFTVRRTACIQLAVCNRGGERPRGPFRQLAHRLDIVMSVDNKRLWTTATLAVNDRITRTNAKRARADADPLHRLFDRLRNRAHARAARGHRWHAAKLLQSLGKAACVPVYISIKLRENQSVLSVVKIAQTK